MSLGHWLGTLVSLLFDLVFLRVFTFAFDAFACAACVLGSPCFLESVPTSIGAHGL